MIVERGRFRDVADEPSKLGRRCRPLDRKIAQLGETVFDLLDATFERLPSIGPPFISPLCSLEPFEQFHFDSSSLVVLPSGARPAEGLGEVRGPLREHQCSRPGGLVHATLRFYVPGF